MRRTSIIAAAIGSLLVASSSFAGFTISHTKTEIDANTDRYDIFALNTGGDTGTGLIAAEIFGANVVGQSFWNSASSGNWRPTNSSEVEGRSFVRLDPLDPGSTSLVAKEPAANQPVTGGNTVALGNFGVTVTSLSGALPADTGAGALFTQLFVTKNYEGDFTGNVGGSAGAKVAYSFRLGGGTPPPNVAPTIGANSGASVVFGSIVTTPLPFSGTVVVSDADTADTVALALGTLPSNVSGVTITPTGQNPNGTIFTVSGNIAYVGNGPTNIPIIASDNSTVSGDTNGVFVVNVTPEPASLSALALSSLLMGRRRK